MIPYRLAGQILFYGLIQLLNETLSRLILCGRGVEGMLRASIIRLRVCCSVRQGGRYIMVHLVREKQEICIYTVNIPRMDGEIKRLLRQDGGPI